MEKNLNEQLLERLGRLPHALRGAMTAAGRGAVEGAMALPMDRDMRKDGHEMMPFDSGVPGGGPHAMRAHPGMRGDGPRTAPFHPGLHGDGPETLPLRPGMHGDRPGTLPFDRGMRGDGPRVLPFHRSRADGPEMHDRRGMRGVPGHPPRPPFARERVLDLLLDSEDGMRQKALGERMGVNPSSMSEFIARLEMDGYVARKVDPEDRRATVIALTELGRARALEVRDERQARSEAMFGALTEDEKWELIRLLDKLVPQEASAGSVPVSGKPENGTRV